MQKEKTARGTGDFSGLRSAVNGLIVTQVAVACWLLVFRNDGVVAATGWETLKYYTVLSNLLEGAASLIWIAVVSVLRREPRWVAVLKYTSAVCVGLTMVTVIVFLGPVHGFGIMYVGANLFYHLLVPLCAMAELVLLNRAALSLRDNAAAVLPTVVYGTVYLINVLVKEPGDNPLEHDFYGFALWGIPLGVVGLAVICLVAFMIGWLLRGGNRRVCRLQIQEG